jgi:DNA-binding LacI/PurR family transcriptional regulator
MPTIKDVAREAGVSIATVSYVLNNKRSLVSDDTRRQVLETIERIGYTPNSTARNLKASRTRLIGYAWHQVPNGQMNPVLDQFVYYLAQAAEAHGYHLLTFTHPTEDPVPAYAELIRTGRIDSFVVAETTRHDPRIRFLLDSSFPFAAFGRSEPQWNFNWVDTDGTDGMRQVVEYLVRLGHRQIAMVAWPADSVSGEYRVLGYREGLAAAGLEPCADYLIRIENFEQAGREAFRRLWSLPTADRPTAIVAVTDLVAVGMMNQAEAMGLRVGQDVAIVGFDDAPMSQHLRPALTTVRQPITAICNALVNQVDALRSELESDPQHILLRPQLIVRQSCGG